LIAVALLVRRLGESPVENQRNRQKPFLRLREVAQGSQPFP